MQSSWTLGLGTREVALGTRRAPSWKQRKGSNRKTLPLFLRWAGNKCSSSGSSLREVSKSSADQYALVAGAFLHGRGLQAG